MNADAWLANETNLTFLKQLRQQTSRKKRKFLQTAVAFLNPAANISIKTVICI